MVAVGLISASEIKWDKGLYCLENKTPKKEKKVKDLIYMSWVNVVGGFWTKKTGTGPNLSKMLWRTLSFCPIVKK